jgi:hypothetical protein
MATLTVRDSSESGVTFTETAANSGGDEFVNSGRELLVVKNEHGSNSYTVTITAQVTTLEDTTHGTLTKSNTAKACAAGSVTVFGPFPTAAWNDANSKVQITYSAVDSLKVDVIKI